MATSRRTSGPTQGEQAYLELRRMITDCDLAPGSSVSEPELTERLGIQKAAVRAALLRLSHDGLITAVPRQGYVVSPLTIKDALDLVELRLLVEPRAAFLAAGRMDARLLDGADAMYEGGYDRSNNRSIRAYLKRNREFKIAIARASGNPRLASWVADVSASFDRYIRLSILAIGWPGPKEGPSRAVVQGLRTGDGKGAAAALREAIHRAGIGVMMALLHTDGSSALHLLKGHGDERKVIDELLRDRFPELSVAEPRLWSAIRSAKTAGAPRTSRAPARTGR